MPLEIIRNDLTNMCVDAIVNPADSTVKIGSGVDFSINQKAGSNLFKERIKIGNIEVGSAAITPAFNLDANYVIHTVGPLWIDGNQGEEDLMIKAYNSALNLAKENNCESIAFPLISTGNFGFPKRLALQIANKVFKEFLEDNEMLIYLVVYTKDAFEISEELFESVSSYIDDNYIDEYFDEEPCCDKGDTYFQAKIMPSLSKYSICYHEIDERTKNEAGAYKISARKSLEEFLEELDMGFSDTLRFTIIEKGYTPPEVYKRANIDRKLFAKIMSNPDYQPTKSTALAFSIGLQLNLNETKEFIAKAGFALTRSKKQDLIVQYFIENNQYDIFEINETLYEFDQVTLS